MFLHLSAILFTEGGGEVSVQGGLSKAGVAVQGGLCQAGISVQGGLCSEGFSLGLSVGGGRGRGGFCQEDPRTVESGRCASYWNAFLVIHSHHPSSHTWIIRGIRHLGAFEWTRGLKVDKYTNEHY